MKKYTIKEKIIFEFINDWEQIIPNKKIKWNWYSFQLIQIYFEKDNLCGEAYEFWFVFFGLGFYFRYNTNKSMKYFDKLTKKIKKNKNG